MPYQTRVRPGKLVKLVHHYVSAASHTAYQHLVLVLPMGNVLTDTEPQSILLYDLVDVLENLLHLGHDHNPLHDLLQNARHLDDSLFAGNYGYQNILEPVYNFEYLMNMVDVSYDFPELLDYDWPVDYFLDLHYLLYGVVNCDDPLPLGDDLFDDLHKNGDLDDPLNHLFHDLVDPYDLGHRDLNLHHLGDCHHLLY